MRDVPPRAHGGVSAAPRALLEPSRVRMEGRWPPEKDSRRRSPAVLAPGTPLPRGLHSCGHRGLRLRVRVFATTAAGWGRAHPSEKLRSCGSAHGPCPLTKCHLLQKGLRSLPLVEMPWCFFSREGRTMSRPAVDSGFCPPRAAGPLAEGSILQPRFFPDLKLEVQPCVLRGAPVGVKGGDTRKVLSPHPAFRGLPGPLPPHDASLRPSWAPG